MRSCARILVLGLGLVLSTASPLAAAPSLAHTVTGTMTHPDGTQLTVAAYEVWDGPQGGEARLATPDGSEVDISLDCVRVFIGFEGGHGIFASGTGSDGFTYGLQILDAFPLSPYGDVESFGVTTAVDEDAHCGVPWLELRSGVGDFVVVL